MPIGVSRCQLVADLFHACNGRRKKLSGWSTPLIETEAQDSALRSTQQNHPNRDLIPHCYSSRSRNEKLHLESRRNIFTSFA